MKKTYMHKCELSKNTGSYNIINDALKNDMYLM